MCSAHVKKGLHMCAHEVFGQKSHVHTCAGPHVHCTCRTCEHLWHVQSFGPHMPPVHCTCNMSDCIWPANYRQRTRFGVLNFGSYIITQRRRFITTFAGQAKNPLKCDRSISWIPGFCISKLWGIYHHASLLIYHDFASDSKTPLKRDMSISEVHGF